MDMVAELARVNLQEQRLRLPRFDLDVAWQLGVRLREVSAALSQPLAVEVRLGRETVFFSAMAGVTPVNADWIRRKRNTVELMHRSSYGVGLELQQQGRTLQDTMGLPERDFAPHGGSFPLWLAGVGCVGVATVSGAPQRADHTIVVRVLAELCGIPVDEVALD